MHTHERSFNVAAHNARSIVVIATRTRARPACSNGQHNFRTPAASGARSARSARCGTLLSSPAPTLPVSVFDRRPRRCRRCRARKRGRSTSKQQAAAAAAAEHTISGADATGRHQPLATGGHGAHLGIAGEPKLEIFGFWSAWQPRRRQQREPREGDTGPGPGPGPWPAAGPGPIENGKGQGSWLRAYEARQGPSCMWGPAD